MRKRILILAGVLFLSACATGFKQTENVLESSPHIPPSMVLKNTPFVNQEEGYCGPAVLTMALRSAGHEISVNELVPQVYIPGRKGSLQQDMISATRRHGHMAVPLDDLSAILQEVASGHPVIVFQNLGLSWYPRWHYALVVGYDLEEERLVMHSGPNAFETKSMRRFELSWELANYWALVVLPPDELAATADDLAHLRAAAGLEQASQFNEAERAYKAILKRWPESLGALIGLGNIAFRERRTTKAVEYLRRAVKAHPSSKAAHHNLAVAEKAADAGARKRKR
ncbi:MAG: PA2778 family cysteine peptidase [Bdellovibrionales bacterium]